MFSVYNDSFLQIFGMKMSLYIVKNFYLLVFQNSLLLCAVLMSVECRNDYLHNITVNISKNRQERNIFERGKDMEF